MDKINAEWHEANKMPKNVTHEQKILWHIEHQKHCSCWPIPPQLLTEINNAKKDTNK